MALETASSSRTRTASSRVSTPFLTRARNSATVAVTAAIVYAASSNAVISRFPVMIQIAAGSHITLHQRRMRQGGRAGSKGAMAAGGWLHFKRTTTVGGAGGCDCNTTVRRKIWPWVHYLLPGRTTA